MFVPAQYRAPGSAWIADLVKRNPLAQFSSNGSAESGPFASHIPIILPPGRPDDDLVGSSLLGHMNRANPHWAAVGHHGTSVATFTGPHSYVSPSLYETPVAAPTWDFTAVHLRGRVERLARGKETLDVVVATVAAFESLFGDGWSMDGSLEYFERILPAVGAFRFSVDSVEAMFKLSQEQPHEVRDKVCTAFANDGCTHRNDVAAMMARLPITDAGGTSA